MRGNSLTQSLAIQSRVIYALVMREVITRYGRNNIGFLWLFVHPMLFTACVTYIWATRKAGVSSTIPIPTLALTGYSATMLWRLSSSRCVKALDSNIGLLWHRNVKPIDIYLSRIFLEIVGTSVSLIILTIVFILMGKISVPVDLLKVICGWLLLCALSLSLSLFAGVLSEKIGNFNRFWSIFTLLLFPISGAAILVDWAPPSFQKILLLVPMVHAIEFIREGFCGSAVHAHYDLLYLSLSIAVILFISLALRLTNSNETIINDLP